MIQAAIESGRMPPWLPEPGCGDFAGELRLDEPEVDAIRAWIEAGMPPGDTSALPSIRAVADDWQLAAPDLVLQMPDPFVLRPGPKDVFRNFVIPVPTDSVRFVRAFELRPGARAVHHAMLRVDRTESSRRLDRADDEPGFEGMTGFSDARAPEGYFLAWTPGKRPFPGYPDMSWRLEPGSDLVLQAHLRPTAQPDTIQAQIGLHFADEPPGRHPALLRLGSQTIDIAAGEPRYVIEDSYTLPVDVRVLSVYPHAHYLAKEMRGRATLPDSTERCLIHIKDWDLNWQDEYRYREAVSLPKGTRLTMRYTYDNSSANPQNPHQPPRRVRYGPNASDEMGDLWIQAVTRDRNDLALLNRDFGEENLRAELAGLEQMVRQDPDDAILHHERGRVLQALGRAQDAIGAYREAIRLRPDLAVAHFGLGLALESSGDFDEAIGHYRAAVRADPDHGRAHLRLGEALQSRGAVTEAIALFRRGVELRPDDSRAHTDLGVALRAQGQLAEAIRHLRRAVELEPDAAVAHHRLGNALQAQDRLDEAASHYRRAVELEPDFVAAHNDLANVLLAGDEPDEAIEHYQRALRIDPTYGPARTNLERALPALAARAWTLATHPDAAARDPDQAIRLAERAARLTGYQNPIALDALAAAYASAGLYDRAVTAAERGLNIARAAGARGLEAALRERLALYRQQQPYIHSAGGGPSGR